MTLDEIIEVVTAAKGGKQIQWRRNDAPRETPWANDPHPTWDFYVLDYRVKPPEPREWWLNVYPCGVSIWANKAVAKKYLSRDGEIVHVREVL